VSFKVRPITDIPQPKSISMNAVVFVQSYEMPIIEELGNIF